MNPEERILLERLIETREQAERDRPELALVVELARALGQQDVVEALTGGRR